MPNGFICQEHIEWSNQSENMHDQYGPNGKRDIEKQRALLLSICVAGGKANLGVKHKS
jgi:hypothetical protein